MKAQQKQGENNFEKQTVQQLCTHRKQSNFQTLKEWDQKRAERLVLHRRLVDEIDLSLQHRITESNDFLRVVLQFFQLSVEQKKKYDLDSATNPQSKFKHNSATRNIYKEKARTFMKLYKTTQNSKHLRKVRGILEEGGTKINSILSECKREITQIRTKIQLLAVEIQNSNERTVIKCEQVLSQFNKDKQKKAFQSEIDFFKTQQEFLLEANEQMLLQKKFGQSTIAYLQYAQEYEKMKLQTVKEVLSAYLSVLSENNEQKQKLLYLTDILNKKTEQGYINLIYSAQELIQSNVLQEVRKIIPKHKLNINTIKNFLTKLQYSLFDSRNLIMKEYKAFMKIDDEIQDCYILLTVDGFADVCLASENFDLSLASIDISFRLKDCQTIEMEGEIHIKIILRKLLKYENEQRKRIVFLFQSEDKRDEFFEFVSSIIT